MPQERTREMNALRKTLKTEFATLSSTLLWNSELDKDILSLLKCRICRSVGIRSYFVYKAYRYIAWQAREEQIKIREDFPARLFEVQAPFLAESLITNAYYHNQILDRKGGVTTAGRINANLISGNLLRSFIHSYARGIFYNKSDLYEIVFPRLERIFECVDLAQLMDKNWGSYESFLNGIPADTRLEPKFEQLFQYADLDALEQILLDTGLPPAYLPFTRLYLRRGFLANAPLFILLAEIIMDLLGYNGKMREGLLRFAGNYGLLSQLVNDNIDMISAETGDRKKEDTFSDLINGTISLPLLLLLSKNPTIDLIKLQKKTKHFPVKVYKVLLPVVVEQCIPITGQFALRLYDILASDNPESDLLTDMASLGYKNTYYYTYLEDYEKYGYSSLKKSDF